MLQLYPRQWNKDMLPLARPLAGMQRPMAQSPFSYLSLTACLRSVYEIHITGYARTTETDC